MTLGSFAHSGFIAWSLIKNDLKEGMRKHLAAPRWSQRILQCGGLLFALSFFFLLHAGAYSVIGFIGASGFSAGSPRLASDAVRGMSVLVWNFLIFIMLSGGLVRALVVLHEQDDSNLLLSAPVVPRAVLAGRLFGNALQSCLIDGFIIVPWIDALIFLGHPNYLFGYLVWLALAIIVTCFDALISFSLVRAFGLRRARTISQIVPFILIFIITFASLQLGLSATHTEVMSGGSGALLPTNLRDHLIALGQSPLAWIPRASAGSPLPLLGLLGLTTALAWVTLLWTEKPFIAGTQDLQESSDSPAVRHKIPPPFGRSLLALEVRKNIRMVMRTPMILVQSFSQILTPIGLAFVIARVDLAQAITFFVLFTLGVLTVILTIAAGTVESCDELLQMAPRRALLFRLGKMLSGLLLPFALACPVFLGLLIAQKFHYAAALLFAGVPLALSSAIVGETFAQPLPIGVKPKLLSSPIMIIPLLGTQILSGLISGLCAFAAGWSWIFLAISCVSSYVLLFFTVGLAQLRKPLELN